MARSLVVAGAEIGGRRRVFKGARERLQIECPLPIHGPKQTVGLFVFNFKGIAWEYIDKVGVMAKYYKDDFSLG